MTENAARIVYKNKKSVSNKFIYYYTKSDKFKDFIRDATKKVAMPKLALSRLGEIELSLPNLDEQLKAVDKFKKIEDSLNDLDFEINSKIENLNL